MIQDLFPPDTFRWSLAPDFFYESRNSFIVVWNGITPQCGDDPCVSMQGAMLVGLKNFRFADPDLLDCGQVVTQDAICTTFSIALYKRVKHRYDIKLVTRAFPNYTFQLLEVPYFDTCCGQTTSIVTANQQLNFWRNTSGIYQDDEGPFTFSSERKTLVGPPLPDCPPGFIICEDDPCECCPLCEDCPQGLVRSPTSDDPCNCQCPPDTYLCDAGCCPDSVDDPSNFPFNLPSWSSDPPVKDDEVGWIWPNATGPANPFPCRRFTFSVCYETYHSDCSTQWLTHTYSWSGNFNDIRRRTRSFPSGVGSLESSNVWFEVESCTGALQKTIEYQLERPTSRNGTPGPTCRSGPVYLRKFSVSLGTCPQGAAPACRTFSVQIEWTCWSPITSVNKALKPKRQTQTVLFYGCSSPTLSNASTTGATWILETSQGDVLGLTPPCHKFLTMGKILSIT